MRAIVTGADGFLGSHLVRHLQQLQWQVTAIVRQSATTARSPHPGVEYRAADLARDPLDPTWFQQADVVIHTAGILSDWAPWSLFQTNMIDATARLAAQTTSRFIYISSVSVYGRPTTPAEIDETWPCRPTGRWSYYMRAKISAEQIARTHSAATILRPAIIYGTHDKHVLGSVISRLRARQIMLLGNPATPLPLIHVSDVVDAIVRAAESSRAVGEAYNLVNPEMVTQRDYFNTIASLIGAPPVTRRLPYRLAYGLGFAGEILGRLARLRTVPVTRHRVSLFGHRRRYSIAKAREHLGWDPQTRFHQGIQGAVAWHLALHAAHEP